MLHVNNPADAELEEDDARAAPLLLLMLLLLPPLLLLLLCCRWARIIEARSMARRLLSAITCAELSEKSFRACARGRRPWQGAPAAQKLRKGFRADGVLVRVGRRERERDKS
jgi:hypothetical protein